MELVERALRNRTFTKQKQTAYSVYKKEQREEKPKQNKTNKQQRKTRKKKKSKKSATFIYQEKFEIFFK